MFETEYRKEPYMCNKCKRFHRYEFKGKPSETHLEHFGYFHRYISDYTQTELFNLDLKESWKRESKKEKVKVKDRSRKPLFIN